MNIPNIKLIKEESTKCGIVGTHMRVMVNGEEEVSEDVNLQENNDLHEHDTRAYRMTMNMTTTIVMDTTHIVVFLILKRLLMG